MAWSLVNSALGTATIGTGALTKNFNLTGGDVLVVICIHSGTTPTLTATWNGNAMTQMWRKTESTIAEVSTAFVLGSGSSHLTSGTRDVVVTPSANVDILQIIVAAFTGSDTTTATDAPYRASTTVSEESGNTTVTTPISTATISGLTSGDLIVDGVHGYSGSITKGASQTLIQSQASVAGGSYNIGSSFRDYTGSSFDMTWTLGASGFWAAGAAALIPASGAAAVTLPQLERGIRGAFRGMGGRI